MKRIHACGIVMSVLVAFLVMCQNSTSHGQHSGKRTAASPPKSESETNSDTQALIGQFGYKIQVPEMTMNQISASGKSKPPVSVPQQSTPIISAPVPDRIVTEEVSAQPVKTPKPPEVQKPVEEWLQNYATNMIFSEFASNSPCQESKLCEPSSWQMSTTQSDGKTKNELSSTECQCDFPFLPTSFLLRVAP